MALYGSLAALRAQTAQFTGFAAAFAYLEALMRPDSEARKRLAAIADGDHHREELSEGAYVIEQVYETRLRADGFFESHREYIDIQTIVEGEELMEIADIARMTVRQPYNADRDFIIYENHTDASWLRVFPGWGCAWREVRSGWLRG